MKIALVACVELPEPDPDELPLLEALRGAGHEARTICWDDRRDKPGDFDACVIRATWNYHRRVGPFRDWLSRAAGATWLINPYDTVLWNMHKRYLCDLEARRIPIVPTAWADRGTRHDLAAVAKSRGWSKVVVKPAVSGGSRETRVFDMGDAGQAAEGQRFLEVSSEREDTMVQRYLASVERGGEVSVICLGGEISHAIEKRPRFAGQEETVVGHPEITEAERRFAAAVLEACPYPGSYARVDLMRLDDGGLVLSELEMIEPSLFFAFGAGSAERFVKVLEREVELA